jgi:hypothetical protein
MITSLSSEIPYRTTLTNGRVRIASDALKAGRAAVRLDRSVPGRATFRWRCHVDGGLEVVP